MNDNDTVTVVRDSLATAKDSLAGVHMDTPLEAIVRNGRARRRRHTLLTGVTGAMAVMAGAVLVVTTLAPSGRPSGPSGHVGSQTPTAQLAAWMVDRQINGDIEVTVRQLSDPSGLQSTLRADGVPTNVTAPGQPDPSCRPYPMSQALFTSVYHADKTSASGDTVLIIDPSALPSGVGIQIGSAVGRDPGVSGLHRTDVNQAIHHAVDQPADQAAANNGVLRADLVYASQQCTGS
jgi:hypothetical protein